MAASLISLGLGLLMGPMNAAHAAHCVAPQQIQLNVLIDISHSMGTTDDDWGDDWKAIVAGDLAADIFDGFRSDDVLSAAGVAMIPYDDGASFDVRGGSGHLDEVRDQFVYPSPAGTSFLNFPLYLAIQNGADHLGGVTPSGKKVLIVIAHKGNDYPDGSESAAASAIGSSGASTYLYYLGHPSVYDGTDGAVNAHGALSRIASSSGADFNVIYSDTAIAPFVSEVLDEGGCANYAPDPSVTVSPETLRLGDPGFQVELNARATEDPDPDQGLTDLSFAWTVSQTDPGGRPDKTRTGDGHAGALFAPTFTDDDIGSWAYEVEVGDGRGGRHIVSGTFEVLNSPPRLEVSPDHTIEAGDELSVEATVAEDPDGGDLAHLQWTQVSGPYVRPDGPWDGESFGWITTSDDITVLSDDSRYASAWRFQLLARDNEGSESTAEIEVEVENLPVPAEIDGPDRVSLGSGFSPGDTITLRSLNNSDPDGGPVTRTWRVVQAPDADSEGSSLYAGDEGPDSDTWTMALSERDAGTWIFRLTLTDDEGETSEADHELLVEAPPEASLSGPTEAVGSITGRVELDGSGSIDPDTRVDPTVPCGAPDYCHTNIDGPTAGITAPPIARWSWRLVDVPRESRMSFPTGGVEESLGIPARSSRLELPRGTLPPGLWTFQLEVEDAEGNFDSQRLQFEVFDESSAPVAILPPPREYTLSAAYHPEEAIAVSGAESHDPDDFLPGGDPPGIDSYEWTATQIGPDCVDPPDEPDTDSDSWTLFPEGATLDPTCLGIWEIDLTVAENDADELKDTAETSVIVGRCEDPVCLRFPTTADPAYIRADEEQIDLSIVFDLGAGVFSNPAFRSGLIVRTRIFNTGEYANPVFEQHGFNFIEPEALDTPSFMKWSGYRGGDGLGGRGFTAGAFDVELAVLSPSGSEIHRTRESNAIAISAGNRIIDCGTLWTEGFPDRRYMGSFPCVEYEEPFRVSSADYTIYHAPQWPEGRPLRQALLRWTSQVMQRAWATLSPFGDLPQMAVVLSNRPRHYSPMANKFIGMVHGEHWLDGDPLTEPCPIILYPGAFDDTPAEFRQTVAHEVIHCFQFHDIGVSSDLAARWWKEGTAEFLSNIVYPDTNKEFDEAAEFSPASPIPFQDYPSAVFFQSWANHPAIGIAGIIDLMRRLGDAPFSDHAAVLGATPSADEALHRFARRWLAYTPGSAIIYGDRMRWTSVRDTGPGFWPRLAYIDIESIGFDGDEVLSGSTVYSDVRAVDGDLVFDRSPYEIQPWSIAFDRGHIYQLEVAGIDPSVRVSLLDEDFQPFPSGESPEFRPGCSDPAFSAYLLITNASGAAIEDAARLSVNARPDPDCGGGG